SQTARRATLGHSALGTLSIVWWLKFKPETRNQKPESATLWFLVSSFWFLVSALLRRMKRALVLTLFVALPAFALEGKWTPQQVLQLDAAWLKKQGLELPPSRLWDPTRGTGLLAAPINVG